MNQAPEARLEHIGLALEKCNSGEWSAPTTVAAIRRIHAGLLTMEGM